MITKEEYQTKMQLKLDELKARVEILKTQIDDAELEDKVLLYESIESIRMKQETVSQKMIEMNTVPDSTWEDLKINLDSLWTELVDSFETTLKRLSNK